MKQIKTVVPSCPNCPFFAVVTTPVNTEAGDHYPEGAMCVHRRNRFYVATFEDMERAGKKTVVEYLQAMYGSKFPDSCPLEDVESVPRSSGRRLLDLQPVAGRFDKKSAST